MKYVIDKSAGKPAYMQLYDQLRGDLTSGFYEYGTRLPSKRLLAEETGVSVITVEHAYAILCDEGYAESAPRSGYYAIYRAGDFGVPAKGKQSVQSARAAFDAERGGGDTAGLRGESDELFPYSVMAKTARRIISDYGERLLVKSPSFGVLELRTAIAAYLGRSCGIDASPEQIAVGSGAEYLYSLIVGFLGRDRVYALEDPSYPMIRRVYAANGARIELLPLAPDGIDSAALASSRADVLHVTPFNSYPTGVTATASKRREYLDRASGRGGVIIEDNYDSELTVSRKNEDTLFSLSGGRGVIYLNTFSRTVAPSLRVGYMVIPGDMLDEFERRVGFYSCTVPPLEQYLLARLIENGDFERHVNRVRRARRRML